MNDRNSGTFVSPCMRVATQTTRLPDGLMETQELFFIGVNTLSCNGLSPSRVPLLLMGVQLDADFRGTTKHNARHTNQVKSYTVGKVNNKRIQNNLAKYNAGLLLCSREVNPAPTFPNWRVPRGVISGRSGTHVRSPCRGSPDTVCIVPAMTAKRGTILQTRGPRALQNLGADGESREGNAPTLPGKQGPVALSHQLARCESPRLLPLECGPIDFQEGRRGRLGVGAGDQSCPRIRFSVLRLHGSR